jgi:hypothetical protein
MPNPSRIFLESKSEKFFQTRTLPFRPGGEEGENTKYMRHYAMRLVGIPLVYAKIAVHKPRHGRLSPPGLNASVARLARASLQQKNIRANVDTLAIKPGGGE